jgi:hypothetical protein
MDNVQKHNICVTVLSSRTLRFCEHFEPSVDQSVSICCLQNTETFIPQRASLYNNKALDFISVGTEWIFRPKISNHVGGPFVWISA